MNQPAIVPLPGDEYRFPPFDNHYSSYLSFPVECLSAPVRDYVAAQADRLGCDAASVVLPGLAALASSVGASRVIRLDENWTEPAVLWTALVADKRIDQVGPIDVAVQPLEERKAESLRLHAHRVADFKKLEQEEKKNRRQDSTEPDAISRRMELAVGVPAVERCIVTDDRVDPLLKLLSQQPRGVLVRAPDLHSWLGPVNSSSSKRTTDRTRWNDFFVAKPVEVETSKSSVLHAPHTCVSLTGIIDCEVLTDKFLKTKETNSLTTGLLFAEPDWTPKRLKLGGIPQPLREGYSSVIRSLQSLTFDRKIELDVDDVSTPVRRKRKKGEFRGVDLQWNEIVPESPKDAKGWHEPAETVARFILNNFRYVGPGEGPDGGPRFNPYCPKDPDEGDDDEEEEPVPTFEELQEMLVNLCDDSRHRLQGLVFGKGYGAGGPLQDLVDFIEAVEAYEDEYGEEDPRPKKYVPQTGLGIGADVQPQDLMPGTVELTDEARQLFDRFLEQNLQDRNEVDDKLQPWFTNLPHQAGRLALVLHLTRWASGEGLDPNLCDADSMARGITVARWFAWEARRIYYLASRHAADKEEFRLTDWLMQRGGVATTRDLSRSNGRKYPTDAKAQEVMDKLADQGVGTWVDIPPGPQGGRPFRVLSLGNDFHRHLLPQAEQEAMDARKVVSDKIQKSNKGMPLVPGNPPVPREPVPVDPQLARPKGQRWTLEELVAADPREKLEWGDEKEKRKGKK